MLAGTAMHFLAALSIAGRSSNAAWPPRPTGGQHRFDGGWYRHVQPYGGSIFLSEDPSPTVYVC